MDPDVSIQELALRHGVHRRTVRQALASAEPPPRKVPERAAPVLGPVKPFITLRLSYSGKAVHRAYATASQEAFLDGHRYAFEQLGGISTVHIRYDNLKAAVSRVLMGRTRVESDRWVTFRFHYGFDVFYCRPGVDGAHEKGGVEGEGGRFRRSHTVPMPKVDTLAELNGYFARCDRKDHHRRVGQRGYS